MVYNLDRQTDRQTQTETDRQTGRQAGRQTKYKQGIKMNTPSMKLCEKYTWNCSHFSISVHIYFKVVN